MPKISTTRTWVSLGGAAAILNMSTDSVLALVRNREIAAIDARQPGAKAPRYRIERDELDRWRESRTFIPGQPVPKPLRVVPRAVSRFKAVLARGREERRRKAAAVRCEA